MFAAVVAPVTDAAGVPQFQVEYFSGQLFWGVLSFLLLLYLLRRFILPRIQATLDERAESIAQQLQEAETARQEAAALLQRYQVQHRKLEEEHRAMLLKAEKEINAIRDEKLAELRRAQQRYKQELVEEATYAKHKASEDVGVMAVELALTAVEQLLQQQPPPVLELTAIIESLQGKSTTSS
jgi:F-type H+-transporting ATPase subunit b